MMDAMGRRLGGGNSPSQHLETAEPEEMAKRGPKGSGQGGSGFARSTSANPSRGGVVGTRESSNPPNSSQRPQNTHDHQTQTHQTHQHDGHHIGPQRRAGGQGRTARERVDGGSRRSGNPVGTFHRLTEQTS
mgnify:CR=1 FL=1